MGVGRVRLGCQSFCTRSVAKAIIEAQESFQLAGQRFELQRTREVNRIESSQAAPVCQITGSYSYFFRQFDDYEARKVLVERRHRAGVRGSGYSPLATTARERSRGFRIRYARCRDHRSGANSFERATAIGLANV